MLSVAARFLLLNISVNPVFGNGWFSPERPKRFSAIAFLSISFGDQGWREVSPPLPYHLLLLPPMARRKTDSQSSYANGSPDWLIAAPLNPSVHADWTPLLPCSPTNARPSQSLHTFNPFPYIFPTKVYISIIAKPTHGPQSL